MKTIALLLATFAVASAIEWPELHTKWNSKFLDPFRLNSFFNIPRTLSEVRIEGWVEVTGLNSLGLTTYCYPNDGQLCVLLDGYGYFAGFQAGILRSDVDPTADIYPVSVFDVYTNKTIFGEDFVTTTVYTVDPETLKAGGRRDWQSVLGTEGVWIEKTPGVYMIIPRDATDLDSKWIREACIAEMGTHYYYDMSPTTQCKDFFPWFLLYDDGELSGLGLQAFGACTIKSRSWCEWVPSVAIRPTVPTTPQCLVDWVAKYGTISRHFYFGANPRDTSC